MTLEKPKDDRTKTIGVRMTDEELADLPPAGSDAARVKSALMEWRDLRQGLDATRGPQSDLETLRTDIAGRLDVLQAAVEARLNGIADGPDAFHRLALEADTRDIETSLCDVWAVCMEVWRQTLNNHLNITLIREALVDGDADPETLKAERLARVQAMLPEPFEDYRDRSEWMVAYTETWRQMRLRERAEHEAGGAPTAQAAAE